MGVESSRGDCTSLGPEVLDNGEVKVEPME